MHKRNAKQAGMSAGGRVLLSVDEAALAMSVGRTLVYDLVMRNEIPSIKLGRMRRIPVASLHEYVRRRLEREQRGA